MVKKDQGQKKAEKAKRRKDRKAKTPGPVSKRRDVATAHCLNIIEKLFSGAPALPQDFRSQLATDPEFIACILSKVALALDQFLHSGAPWPYLLLDLKAFEGKFSARDQRPSFQKLLLLSFGADQSWLPHLNEKHWPYTRLMPEILTKILHVCTSDELELLKLPVIMAHASSIKSPSATIKKAVLHYFCEFIEFSGIDDDLEMALKELIKAAALNPLKPSQAIIKLEKLLRNSYDDEDAAILGVIGGYMARYARLRQPSGVADADWYQNFPKISKWLLRIEAGTVLPPSEFLTQADISVDPEKWQRFLEARIDTTNITAEDAFRLDILRAKLLGTEYSQSGLSGDVEIRARLIGHLESAFDRLCEPANAHFARVATRPFINNYVRVCAELAIFRVNLALTKKLIALDSESWNLALLGFVGEVMSHGSGSHILKLIEKKELARPNDELFFASLYWLADFSPKNEGIFYDRFIANLSVLEQEHLLDAAFTTLLVQGAVANSRTRKLLVEWVAKSVRLLDRYRAGALQESSFKYICALVLAEKKQLSIENLGELSILLGQHNKWVSRSAPSRRDPDSFYQQILLLISDVNSPIDWLVVFLEHLPKQMSKSFEADIVAFLRLATRKGIDLSAVKSIALELFPCPKIRDIFGVAPPTKKVKAVKAINKRRTSEMSEFERFWNDNDL